MEMDNLQAPLISNRDPEDRDDVLDDAIETGVSSPAGSVSGSGSGHALVNSSSPGLFMWLLTFSAGISGLLFGCTDLDLQHFATCFDPHSKLST